MTLPPTSSPGRNPAPQHTPPPNTRSPETPSRHPGATLRSLGAFTGRHRALHLSWLAFFSSFLVWFNFAPFSTTIGRQLHRSAGQLATISLCNLGLTVPARLLVGVALDRFGPRVHVISPAVLGACLAALALIAAAQVAQVLRINRPALADAYPASTQYPFRAVVISCLAYAVTFGGELAVLSMLPTFYGQTWHLGVATAGAAAGTFGLMNLVTRPAGGIVSDWGGRRRLTLVATLAGAAVGFGVMSQLQQQWPVLLAVLRGIGASAFLQGGSGATFAVVPQIAPRVGGQLAGLVGAYGNIGGIVLLFALLYVTPQRLFGIIGASAAVVGGLAWRFLPEPAADPPATEDVSVPVEADGPAEAVLAASR